MTFTFHKCANGNYVLFGPYNADLVEDLKSSLEWWQRRWDPSQKGWQIDRDAFRRAAEICMRYGTVAFRDNGPYEAEQQEREQEQQRREQRDREERDRRQATEEARRQRERWARDQQWRTPPRTSSIGCPYQVLHLQPGAPLEVVRAAYRALALKWHPDKGGDDEKMKRINAAHDTIMRQRGERK